jgi:hypothetical protein
MAVAGGYVGPPPERRWQVPFEDALLVADMCGWSSGSSLPYPGKFELDCFDYFVSFEPEQNNELDLVART